jgi:N utilization substance protein B
MSDEETRDPDGGPPAPEEGITGPAPEPTPPAAESTRPAAGTSRTTAPRPAARPRSRTASEHGDRAAHADRIRSWRAGRRLALASVFEAEFGQRTPTAILERHLAETEGDPGAADLARRIVAGVVQFRDRIDADIERIAPQYPVVQLARMDRALLRCAVGEVLHSGTTPARVAIAEWVELARTYSGDPARRLTNGILGRIAAENVTASARSARREEEPTRGSEPPGSTQEGVSGRRHVRAAEEDRR